MMKILVVQEADWLERGPHQNHHLMERLSKKEYEIRVIDFKTSWREKDAGLVSSRRIFHEQSKAVHGGRVTVVRPAIVNLPILEYLSLVVTHQREIQRQIREYQPDVIIGFGIVNTFLAARAARKQGIPFVYYVIDELYRLVPQAYFHPLARLVESINMRNADRVLSISEALRGYTMRMGAKKEKTMVVSTGIDLERFNPDRYPASLNRSRARKDRDTVLFFMGWLYEFSGLRELALDLSEAQEKYPNIKLFVVGRGDLYDELLRIKEEKLGDRLTLLDWQPYEQIPQLIAGADICILPAYNNGIMENIVPIKLYEYMAMEKPVIATHLPGVEKEFGEHHGVTYVDNPHEVLEKAVEIVRQRQLADEGRRARKSVEQNDWNKITEDFEHILRELT